MDGTLRQETYLPDHDEGTQVAKLHDFLKAHENASEDRPDIWFLSGTTAEDRVELPGEVYHALRQVVEAMREGLAVSVSPHTRSLSTQQAAELLGVSRPTVVRLLDDQEIPYERVGTHRRILLQDLLDYRRRRRAEQYAALEATALDEDEDLDETLDRLREARRAVSARRRREAH
ncbi:helix-turn-helix domain-containing protein [Amycolatopsis suaedae]|uniref:Helix-turn-helix domain-containing protein n=1 Tax=Amycolatopsis suaedae TaxID=2510978 RepID=A0A4Q7J023_9PSEU|nr:helix-turn-helix domain-containing protein [Amycolatopsis suaedae]RZQ60680.1 helix-turn-helix domain-containing protein [Amycolatopsis suaedae]